MITKKNPLSVKKLSDNELSAVSGGYVSYGGDYDYKEHRHRHHHKRRDYDGCEREYPVYE